MLNESVRPCVDSALAAGGRTAVDGREFHTVSANKLNPFPFQKSASGQRLTAGAHVEM